MRSKKRTIGILIVVIVVLLGFAGSLLVYRNKLSSENNSDVYTAVDKEIYEKIVNDAFKNASLEERKEIALNVLNTLESENKIKKDSIKFNDEYNCYFFLYSNGAEGSIILDDCFSSLETNNNINEDNSKNDSIFDIEKGNFEKSISSNYFNKTYIESGNNNANGYIKENLSTYNLTYYPKSALIIDCMDNDYERNLNNVLSQTWTTNDLKTDVRSNVTVEEFKTILNGSDGHSGYDFINIDAHGFIDYNGNPTVFLQEEMNPFENNYSDDRDAKRIGTIFGFLGGEYYLKYNFFEYYYYNALTDEIIWLSCCKGYTNDILVGTLANDCNAKAVIGLTDTVIADYDNRMRDFFIHKLLFGYTVNESLKEAKSVYGKDDAEWYLRKYNKKDNTPAECKNYNGGDETLVELVSINTNGMLSGTVTDESNNPIKDAEIIINNVRGMSHGITATTNENGEYTLECPQDSYKIVVKADGYEVFETDDFVNVVYGEENIFNITLKKVIEPTDHIEPTLNYTAVDLIEKNIPEIISLMNGEYQIIKTENDGYIYIQNQSVLSGMEFYVQVSGDDIISANNGEEIHSDTLKAKLESGELTLDGIQVNKSGKVSETIQADMDYKSCSKVLGDFNCIGGTGGYLGGDVSSLSYYYNDKNAKVILNFNIPEEIYKDLILGKISSVSSEEMKSYNPNLRNVVIRKVETVTTMQTEAKENLIELVPSGKISCYGEHRGAITNNGDLYLWGNNSDGQLGTVTDEFIKVYWDKNGISSTPIKVMENVACASLGYDTSAVITNDGSLYTWGCGRYGRLGNGDDDNSIEPIKIMDNAVSVSLGFEAGAVITNDSSLFVWGYNLYGLGNGDSGPFKSPVKIMDNVKKVKLGGDNGAVITNDDVLYIWGSNIWGQLGNGETTDNMKSPVQVMDKVKDISFGDYYCAILSNSGDIYICGRIVTNKGVIGTASVPTKLEISQQAKEISCCGNTIYFIGEDDCLYEMVKHNSPVKIMENVNCISSNVAITNDGCMYTWGSNECGQLGNGTTEDSEEPIKVMDNVMLS